MSDRAGAMKAFGEYSSEREAVKKGIRVPSESRLVNEAFKKRLEEDAEFREGEEKLKKLGEEAKEKYGYKYASP